jgi:hypothetical protein
MGSCHHRFPSSGDPCADYGAAKCARMAECGLTALFELGDAATCAPRLALWCKANQSIPGSGFTTDKLEACADAVGSLDCNALRNYWPQEIEVGPACSQLMKGTLPAGSQCTLGQSCESGGCVIGDLGPCGTCAPIGHGGDDCVNGAVVCGDGLACDTTRWICMTHVVSGHGDTCAAVGHDCDEGLRCVDGTCESMAQEGEACRFADECDANKQLVCDADRMICAQMVVAVSQIGEACEIWGPAESPVKMAVCAAGSTCLNGVCVATAPDGGSCAGEKPCMYPFSCDPEGDLCALPDWAGCP